MALELGHQLLPRMAAVASIPLATSSACLPLYALLERRGDSLNSEAGLYLLRLGKAPAAFLFAYKRPGNPNCFDGIYCIAICTDAKGVGRSNRRAANQDLDSFP